MDSTPSSDVSRRWATLTLVVALAFIAGGAVLSIIIGDWIALICAIGIAGAPLLAIIPRSARTTHAQRG